MLACGLAGPKARLLRPEPEATGWCQCRQLWLAAAALGRPLSLALILVYTYAYQQICVWEVVDGRRLYSLTSHSTAFGEGGGLESGLCDEPLEIVFASGGMNCCCVAAGGRMRFEEARLVHVVQLV